IGALRGHKIEVRAVGRQARAALDGVVALAARGFDDGQDNPAPPPPSGALSGRGSSHSPIAASPGIGIGPAWSRARGIPAVVAAGPAVLDIAEGTPLVVDGTRGEVIPHPPAGRTQAPDVDEQEAAYQDIAAQPFVKAICGDPAAAGNPWPARP
ncbi:MAG: hypothetical protein ACRDRA_21480, partial [Pseudonocardiaceae bacterium]